MVDVKEKTKQEIEQKLETMNTPLNKIGYLESAMKQNFTMEIKRFLWDKLVELYEERGMYEKAGKAMAMRAGIDISFREKIDSYIKAGEMFAKAGKIDDAENMFIRATRDANLEQKEQIKLAMRNVYTLSAKQLEIKGKKASALKFYERLIKMPLSDIEKKEIKKKLVETYKSLGRFRDAELLEGI